MRKALNKIFDYSLDLTSSVGIKKVTGLFIIDLLIRGVAMVSLILFFAWVVLSFFHLSVWSNRYRFISYFRRFRGVNFIYNISPIIRYRRVLVKG